MKEEVKHRVLAVQRFLTGEKLEAICASLGRSRSWLYKWIKRYDPHNVAWCDSQSTQPANVANHTRSDIEEIVKVVRVNLSKEDLL